MPTRRSNDPPRTSDPSPTGSTRSSSSAPEASPTHSAGARPARGRSTSPSKRRSIEAAPVRVSSEARRAMIAEAAYLRAERRGFAAGHEEDDWLTAEKEVDALLSAGQGAPQ